ncbi:MAG: hypothetical protein HC800_05550 [Phormidesmis sp. RL_2_1]|nr:hypothetical protein [Phormidesmis sp. RL_2_1]
MKRFNFMLNWPSHTHQVLLSGAAIAGLLGAAVLTAQPAQAGTLLEDAAIGAGVGLGTGLVLGDRVGADDAINGAAAGVACNVANEALHEDGERNLLEDVGIGAATSGAVGILTNDDSFLSNAAQGAAACGVIHILD